MPNEGIKKFGKLTPELCSRALAHLPEFRNIKEECPEILRKLPKKRLSEIFDEDYNWASIYELPLNDHIVFVILAINELETFEPPRVWWRLQPLREWSHEQVEEVFT